MPGSKTLYLSLDKMFSMVKYKNEFGEIRYKRRSGPISDDVLRDLRALKLYVDEPIDSVVKRLLQSMDPKEMTTMIQTKLQDINAKMSPGWNSRIRKKYDMVHRRRMSDREWVLKLYENALKGK